jgi:phosphoglucosamine mutase
MGRLFGTDGVRGVANVTPMTAELVLDMGRAIAHVCKNRTDRRHQIVIGKDTRVSGYMLESALTAGICSMGVDVLLIGPMPTPGTAFLTHSMRADAGVVISASHNPYQDNGIKIFAHTGFKLPDAEEDRIEQLITSGQIRDFRPTADEIGKAFRIDDALGRYIEFCKHTFPTDRTLEGLRLVLDCANGATYKIAPIVFRELGADVIVIHNQPDGTNINAGCGSQHPEDLAATVVATGADVGLAFDGDGDRLIAVDERGQVLTGDHLLAICARRYREEGRLQNNRVVTTVMSNFGLFRSLQRLGIDYDIAPVGDRYVLELMRARDAVLGGESSGHVIFLNHHTTGDGIIAALQLLAALRSSGQPLSALAGLVDISPQCIVNVDVVAKPPLEELPALQAALRAAEAELDGSGRVLVRYSGTQPLLRIMVEGPTEEVTRRLCDALALAVREAIG